MNMKAEMEAILNEIKPSDIITVDMSIPDGVTKDEFQQKVYDEALDAVRVVASGMKIAFTGNSGFKTLKEFDVFVRDFASASSMIKIVTQRLTQVMFKDVEKAGKEGEEFINDMKLEVLDMLKEQIINKGE